MAIQNLRTVKQISAETPAFTEASLRWLIFHKNTNGFGACVRKIGGRVLIDVERFSEWVDGHEQPAAARG